MEAIKRKAIGELIERLEKGDFTGEFKGPALPGMTVHCGGANLVDAGILGLLEGEAPEKELMQHIWQASAVAHLQEARMLFGVLGGELPEQFRAGLAPFIQARIHGELMTAGLDAAALADNGASAEDMEKLIEVAVHRQQRGTNWAQQVKPPETPGTLLKPGDSKKTPKAFGASASLPEDDNILEDPGPGRGR
jgi:hypothetical protein